MLGVLQFSTYGINTFVLTYIVQLPLLPHSLFITTTILFYSNNLRVAISFPSLFFFIFFCGAPFISPLPYSLCPLHQDMASLARNESVLMPVICLLNVSLPERIPPEEKDACVSAAPLVCRPGHKGVQASFHPQPLRPWRKTRYP